MHHCSKYLVERRFQRFEFDLRLRITPVLRGTHAFGRMLEISCSGYLQSQRLSLQSARSWTLNFQWERSRSASVAWCAIAMERGTGWSSSP
jgi:hypothetical protein